jgi:hypothetical protein
MKLRTVAEEKLETVSARNACKEFCCQQQKWAIQLAVENEIKNNFSS